MGEFFRGWRRKIGCVTLVMALVFMMTWVRGYYVEDRIEFGEWRESGNRRYAVERIVYLSHHGISYVANELFDGSWFASTPGWRATPIKSNGPRGTMMGGGTVWRWALCGFDLCYSRVGPDVHRVRWTVPYQSIVIPLTLLSSYLLLTKPQKSTSKKITEPVPTEGA